MDWIDKYGFVAFFLAGLLEFLGVPFPGAPVLLAGGALTSTNVIPSPHHWLAATAGAVIADQAWYWLARGRGEAPIRLACGISLNPAACVCKARKFLDRLGAPALLLVKFVPAASNVATPLAAVSGIRPLPFTVYSTSGAALWAGVWLGLGGAFRSALLPLLEPILTWAPRAGGILVALLLILLAIKLAAGWWAVRTDPHPEGSHPQNPFASRTLEPAGTPEPVAGEPGRETLEPGSR